MKVGTHYPRGAKTDSQTQRDVGREGRAGELVGPVVYRKVIDDLTGEQLAEYRTERIRVDLTDEERAALQEGDSGTILDLLQATEEDGLTWIGIPRIRTSDDDPTPRIKFTVGFAVFRIKGPEPMSTASLTRTRSRATGTRKSGARAAKKRGASSRAAKTSKTSKAKTSRAPKKRKR